MFTKITKSNEILSFLRNILRPILPEPPSGRSRCGYAGKLFSGNTSHFLQILGYICIGLLRMNLKFYNWKTILWVRNLSEKIILPGFDRLPLSDVLGFFIKGLQKGYIANRASAISFSFFLAVFPFMIFLFSIIPFIPVTNFQQVLLNLIQDFMPDMAWAMVKETITDIITRPRSGVLIINVLLTLYFSTKGMKSLIDAFNNTYHDIESRSMVKQYIVSFVLVIIISFLLIIAIGLMTFGFKLLKLVLPDIIVNS